MTTSQHVYTAALPGGASVSVRSGNIGLDAGSAPHCRALIETSSPSPATLDALDPRQSPGPRVVVDANGRLFNLGVRDRVVNQGDGVVRLALASDEAMLEDYAPLADDTGASAHQASLRAVVGYVLDKAPNVRRNLVPTPTAGAGSGWGVGTWGTGGAGTINLNSSGTSALLPDPPTMRAMLATWTTAPSSGAPSFDTGIFDIAAGTYTFSGYSASTIVGSTWRLGVQWLTAAGAFVSTSWGPAGRGLRYSVTATRPPTAARARLTWQLVTGTPVVGSFAWFTAAQAEAGPYLTDWAESVLSPGSIDADVTAYWPVTNLLPNPSFESNLGGWGMGDGASSPTRTLMGSPVAPAGTYAMGWTAAAGTSNAIAAVSTTNHPVTPGKWYVFAAYVCSQVGRTTRAAIQWWSNGGTLSSQSLGPTITTTNTQFRRVVVIAQAPEGATHAYPYVNTTGNAAGNVHYVDCGMFYEGDREVPYFDGSMSASSTYAYAWSNVPHGSTSTRTPLVDGPDPESLTWRAGQSAMEFLRPLVQASGLRLVCDENRAWTLRDETYTVPGGLALRYGVNLTSAEDTISRDGGIWFDARVTRYRWTDANGITQERVDSYALPGHTQVSTLTVDAPYPGPGRSEYAVRRAQGRGRDVVTSTVSDWTARADQAVSVQLPNTPAQVGTVQAVTFNLDTDEMTVTTRTRELPAGSIDLLPGTINALAGTINAL